MCRQLDKYRQLVRFLSETLGNTFEVGLFDLTDPTCPLVAAANANSDIQAQIRDLILNAVDNSRIQDGNNLINHPVQTDFDKLLKVSVYFVRDEEEKIIGALWLSMRCDLFLKLNSYVESMLRFSTEAADLSEQKLAAAPATPRELSLDTITEVIREFSVAPARMTLNERQEVICDLYDLGVYNLKGAVARTAEVMQISEQSVYRYIAKLKKARDW